MTWGELLLKLRQNTQLSFFLDQSSESWIIIIMVQWWRTLFLNEDHFPGFRNLFFYFLETSNNLLTNSNSQSTTTTHPNPCQHWNQHRNQVCLGNDKNNDSSGSVITHSLSPSQRLSYLSLSPSVMLNIPTSPFLCALLCPFLILKVWYSLRSLRFFTQQSAFNWFPFQKIFQ